MIRLHIEQIYYKMCLIIISYQCVLTVVKNIPNVTITHDIKPIHLTICFFY